jgi:hypothetical protein
VILDSFKGNIWAGETKSDLALFFDEKAEKEQRRTLVMIFTGKADSLESLQSYLEKSVDLNTPLSNMKWLRI